MFGVIKSPLCILAASARVETHLGDIVCSAPATHGPSWEDEGKFNLKTMINVSYQVYRWDWETSTPKFWGS